MKRDSLVWGVILILLGAGFLVFQLFPDLFGGFAWPWILPAIGAIFVVASLIGRIGGLMIPGVVLLTLGGIFLYQTNTGNWESWAYVWALLPVAAGLGMLIGSLYDREMVPARTAGAWLIGGGLAAFAIFGGFFGLDPNLARYWPVLLILLGLWVLFKALRRPKPFE
jgi:hypothetical protein